MRERAVVVGQEMNQNQVMIVAAEASSGLFAQRLIEFWQKEKRDLHAFGVGTDAMEAIGFERLGRSEEMAVVGASEILEHWDRLKAVFNKLVAEAQLRRPRVVVLMDYPEFNLMLAKKLHALGLNVVYYISPQVWAWRRGRVKTIRKYCKKCLVIFPFEVPFYERHQVPVEFVGHPILDEMPEHTPVGQGQSPLTPGQSPLGSGFGERSVTAREGRARRGVGDTDIVLGLMPGSRRIEIRHHLPVQLEVARNLTLKYPNLRVFLLVAPTVESSLMQDYLNEVRFPVTLVKASPFEMIDLTDLVLAKSGTTTLQVALLKKPMIIMFIMTRFTYWFARLMVHGVKFFGLPNLIMNRQIVPERWQSSANVDTLTKDLEKIIEDSDYRGKMIHDLSLLEATLGRRGATTRVARVLDEYLKTGNGEPC